MPYEALTKRRITQALRRLGTLAREQGVILEVSLYGGTVFTLIYGSRDATKDVDALLRPGETARKLAVRVAEELALPEDWLNDNVRLFLAQKEAKRELKGDGFGENLRICVPTAQYLLAMKLRACRPPLPGYPGDFGDIRFLVKKMQIKSVREAAKIHDKFFPDDAISDVAREVVRAAIQEGQK
jgi:hypothetical protein